MNLTVVAGIWRPEQHVASSSSQRNFVSSLTRYSDYDGTRPGGAGRILLKSSASMVLPEKSTSWKARVDNGSVYKLLKQARNVNEV